MLFRNVTSCLSSLASGHSAATGLTSDLHAVRAIRAFPRAIATASSKLATGRAENSRQSLPSIPANGPSDTTRFLPDTILPSGSSGFPGDGFALIRQPFEPGHPLICYVCLFLGRKGSWVQIVFRETAACIRSDLCVHIL